MDATTQPQDRHDQNRQNQDRQNQRTPWRLLGLLMAMTGIGPVSVNILVPALPNLAVELKADIATVQLTLSAFLMSLATAQLMLGPLSDKLGRRPVVLAGLALAALAPIAAAFAWSIEQLILARIVQAFGAATGVVIGRAIVRDLFDRDRAASMLGLVTTVMVLAPMFAPTIGGALDTAFGWEAIFIFAGLYSLTVLIWSLRALPETRPARSTDASFLRDARMLFANPRFWGYVLVVALATSPFFTFIGGGPHIVVSMMRRTSAEYGLWFAITSVGYMAGNFTASRLSQRLGVNTMIVIGLAVEASGGVMMLVLVALFGAREPAIIFVPQIFLSGGIGILLPNAIAGAVSVRPQAAGSASGLTGFGQMATGAVMAQFVTMALAGALTPMPLALMIFAEIVLAVASFYFLVARPSARPSM